MLMPLRLFTLRGPFQTLCTIQVATVEKARIRVEEHLRHSGYANLRTIEDQDYSIRFIADPPDGRKGRNVAAIDL